ncbi:MAG: helix-turn-helix transcriptional regulator [Clostridia bacterium]|nr:helix-turn-helix transcriptional regulator [Clostridia bacterium]
MQNSTTHVPFLPMEWREEQGYEAHHNFSETYEVTQFHCHDYYEFYIHLHGGEFMGVDNQLFQLKPNQIFILPPFSMHGLSCTKEMHDYERAYLNLSPEVLHILSCGQIDLDQFLRSHTVGGVCTYQLSSQDAEQFLAWLRKIRANQRNENFENDAFHRFQNYTLMMNILSLLCETISHASPVEGEPFGNGIIQNILDYINNHYTQPIRIENLARSFGVSVSWLSHEFVRFTNRSVYDYVLYRRVMLARQQMFGTASLNDIAYQCGFNDYSNFLRSFGKIVGVSPSRYRKQLKRYQMKELDEHMKL